MGGPRHKGSHAERRWDSRDQFCFLLPPRERGPGPSFLGDPSPCCREPWDFVGHVTCVGEKREAQHKLTPWLGCPLHHGGGGVAHQVLGGHRWQVGLSLNTWSLAWKDWGPFSAFPRRWGTPLGNFPVFYPGPGVQNILQRNPVFLWWKQNCWTGIWVATSFIFLSDLSSKAVGCVMKQDPTTKLSSH